MEGKGGDTGSQRGSPPEERVQYHRGSYGQKEALEQQTPVSQRDKSRQLLGEVGEIPERSSEHVGREQGWQREG